MLTQKEQMERLKLYYKNMNDGQVAKALNKSTVTVIKWRRKYGLPCNKIIRDFKIGRKIVELKSEGRTETYISRKLHISRTKIVKYLKQVGLLEGRHTEDETDVQNDAEAITLPSEKPEPPKVELAATKIPISDHAVSELCNVTGNWSACARALGVTRDFFAQWAERIGIKHRLYGRVCQHCGKAFATPQPYTTCGSRECIELDDKIKKEFYYHTKILRAKVRLLVFSDPKAAMVLRDRMFAEEGEEITNLVWGKVTDDEIRIAALGELNDDDGGGEKKRREKTK